MLTVKYIAPNGDEQVFAVQSVRKTSRQICSPQSPFADVQFERLPNSGPGLLRVCNGCVYVMNDAGKTVASYELGIHDDTPIAVLNGPATHTFATIGGDPNVDMAKFVQTMANSP